MRGNTKTALCQTWRGTGRLDGLVPFLPQNWREARARQVPLWSHVVSINEYDRLPRLFLSHEVPQIHDDRKGKLQMSNRRALLVAPRCIAHRALRSYSRVVLHYDSAWTYYCRKCGQANTRHVNGKCLFGSTTFQSMRRDEYLRGRRTVVNGEWRIYKVR